MDAKFTVYYSNRLPALSAFFDQLRTKDHPFKNDPIIIPTEGIRSYLEHYLSRQNKVAAALSFFRAEQFFWFLAERLFPSSVPKDNLFSRDILMWRILALLKNKNRLPLSQRFFHDYLSAHTLSLYQLSDQLSRLFGEYLIYRPDYLKAWQNGETPPELLKETRAADWQKELWQALTEESTSARLVLWDKLQFLCHKDHLSIEEKKALDFKAIHIFTAPYLAPFYLELFYTLSYQVPVNLFSLSPTANEWLHYTNTPYDPQISHPILDTLGEQGRQFQSLLLQHTHVIIEQGFIRPTLNHKPSLLHILQNDLLHGGPPSNLSARYPKPEMLRKDSSLQIHGAYSWVRELEICKDHLIAFLAAHPDTPLEEIAILSPNIEHYLPYIEGVFGQGSNDDYPLPYSITDIKIKTSNPYYGAIELILNWLKSDFEVESVLALLRNSAIAHRRAPGNEKDEVLFFSNQDIHFIESLIDFLNISWGWNGEDRIRKKSSGEAYTWEKGLKRLQKILQQKSNSLKAAWLFYAPSSEIKDENLEKLLRAGEKLLLFMKRLRALYEKSPFFNKEKNYPKEKITAPLREWIAHLVYVLDQLVDGELYPKAQESFLARLHELESAQLTAQVDGPLSFSYFQAMVEKILNTPEEQGSLKYGINLASLMPMRTLSFRFVALLGMNDDAFPRQDADLPFNLIHKHKRSGDLSRHQDDSYLFLELLATTQQALHLSYISKNIRGNEDLNPSPVIEIVIDTVAIMTGIKSDVLKEKWLYQHPLHPFSLRYFTEGSDLTSFQNQYRPNYQKKSPPPSASFLQDYVYESTNKNNTVISLEEFLRFWQNPPAYWLKKIFPLNRPWIRKIQHYEEPFSLLEETAEHAAGASMQLNPKGKKVATSLFHAYLEGEEAFLHKKHFLLQSDVLPSGEFAQIWLDALSHSLLALMKQPLPTGGNLALLRADKRVSKPLHLQLDTFCLNYNLSPVLQDNLILFQPLKKLSAGNSLGKGLLSSYLKHLIHNAGDKSGATYLFTLDESFYFPALKNREAQARLLIWARYFNSGMQKPLPFFNPFFSQILNLDRENESKLYEKWRTYCQEQDKQEGKGLAETFLFASILENIDENESFNAMKTLFYDLLSPLQEGQSYYLLHKDSKEER